MAVATGSQIVSTSMDIPYEASYVGPTTVQVVANGIASAGVASCISMDATLACSASCGGQVSDACGGLVACPKKTGAACCFALGGTWVGGRCVFS